MKNKYRFSEQRQQVSRSTKCPALPAKREDLIGRYTVLTVCLSNPIGQV